MTTHGTTFATALAAAAGLVFSASAAYTVQTGETLQITDETVGNYAGGIAFADATGTVEFNTSAAPGMTISGAGTIAKTGTGGWAITVANSGFTGTWDFRAGAVTNRVAGGFGSTASGAGPVCVRSGATLVTEADTPFRYRVLHVAGTGVDGQGAWVNRVNNTSGLLSCLTLDADATIAFPNYIFFQANGPSAVLDFNGHDLTLATGTVYMMNGTSKNDGNLHLGKNFTFNLRGTFTFDAQYDTTLYASAAGETTTVYFYNECSPQDIPLVVRGTTTLIHAHQFGKGSPSAVYCNQAGEKNNWRGPVRLENADSRLKIGCSASTLDETVTISGPVSGPGNISVHEGGCAHGRVVFSNPTNSFTGTFQAKQGATDAAVVELTCSNAVPDYSKVTITDACVRVKPGADGWDWDDDAVSRFVSQANYESGGCVLINTDACAEKTFTLSGSAIDAACSNAFAVVGHEGEGKVVIEGPVSHPVGYSAYGGTVEYTGDGPINLYGSNAGGGSLHSMTGEVAIVDAECVNVTNFPAYLGRHYGTESLRIENSLLTAFTPNMASNTASAADQAIMVGFNGYPAVMHVGEGTVVTGKLVGAGGCEAAQGAVYQNGGSVTMLCSYGDYGAAGFVDAGQGYYELKKGTLVLAGYGNLTRGNGSRGVFAQYGGTFYTTNHPLYSANGVSSFLNIARDGASYGHYYLKGGTLRTHGNVLMTRGTKTTVMTLDGPEADFDARLSVSHGYAQGTGIFNMNAGVYSGTFGSRFTKNRSGATDSYTAKGWQPKFYVNANGGTIRYAGNPFGYSWDRCPDASTPGPSEVRLYAGGLTYDSRGVTATFENPMKQASGKGVASVPWTARGGYIVSPFVEITGDGNGASAFAEFDSEKGVVTGIRITSAGWDYTWAKAKILAEMGNPCTAAPTNCWLEIDCTLADNAPGCFTRKGGGTTTFAATNTYEGATTVMEGTLKLGGPDVIHANSALVLAGGDFDAAGFAQTFSAIGGSAGHLRNASNVSASVRTLVNSTTAALDLGALSALTVDGVWTIDLLDAKAGRYPVYNTDVVFAPGSTLTVENLEQVDEADRHYTFLKVSAGKKITGSPALQGELPAGWSFVNRGGEIRIFRGGMTMIFR